MQKIVCFSLVVCSCYYQSYQAKFYHEVGKNSLWRKAMPKEIRALEDNQTWTVEDLPPRKKPISCNWYTKSSVSSMD